jgi:hypothetical protein
VNCSFDDLAGVEIVRDGTTLSSTNRGSQALGAAVGAVALGGVGAIIGGLTASSTQSGRVRRIILVLKTRDQSNPIHQVTFFNWDADNKGWNGGSVIVRQAMQAAETFAAHIANAIHASEKYNAAYSIAPQVADTRSLTSEIEELAKMKDKGLLIDEEFTLAKQRLLSSSVN